MRIKLDEDLSPLVAEPLVAAGHDVRSVVGQGWSGLSDGELWPLIMAERVLFITADKGFADLRIHPPGTHDGILLQRPDRESIVEYRRLIEMLLATHEFTDMAGCITVVSPRGVRIRRGISQ